MSRPRARNRRLTVALAILGVVGIVMVVGAFVVGTPFAPNPNPSPNPNPNAGMRGGGDTYFPGYGNGGYDVSHYAVDVAYSPSERVLSGSTTITANATERLERFSLDFVLEVSKVEVDGASATFRQSTTAHPADNHGGELEVTPGTPLGAGAAFKVVVTYSDTPLTTVVGGFTPWIASPTGAVVQGEPESAAWWFPSNDHPIDKATFDFRVTVPAGLAGLSNGRLSGVENSSESSVWSWRVGQPMAPYLAFLAVGDYRVIETTLDSGVVYLSAVEQGESAVLTRAAQDLARGPEVLSWLESKFGEYPFDAAGGVVVDSDYGECCGLENQSRPVYPNSYWLTERDVSIIVHEQAHQWFGDSVSLTRWSDIWLNEGPAFYAEWLWAEDHGGPSAQSEFDDYFEDPDLGSSFWNVRINDPGASRVFHDAVYVRGAMTLHALRTRLGDDTFFALLRAWTSTAQHGHGTTAQFRALADSMTDADLTGFFDTWLSQPGKPAATSDNGVPD